MQTSLSKRSLMSFLDSGPVENAPYYLESMKKLKPSLNIEISDSFFEVTQPIAISSSRASRSQFTLRHSLTIQTTKAATSSSPTCRDRSPFAFDFGKIFTEADTTYDNFYREDDFCNIAMRKCHRRNMEDRVIPLTKSLYTNL